MFRQKLILNWCYILAIVISFLELHAFAPIRTKWRVIKLAHFSTKDDDANNNKDEDPFFDLEELSRRIGNIESNEKKASDTFTEGLKQRARELEMAEKVERSILSPTDESSTSKHAQLIKLPCIVFDALLPKQRLKGNTEDPVFSRFLRDLGLGNLFVMLTVQPKYRKLRRNGMICSIEFVDAAKKANLNTDNKSETDSPGFYPDISIPSAVDFIIVGRKPCFIVGPEKNLNARVGRWKRSYDPDGEEKVLGWGEEKFMDSTSSRNQVDDVTADLVEVDDFSGLKPTEWSSNILQRKFIEDLDEEFFKDQNQKTIIETLEFAQTLIPLIDHWIDLASSSETYENTDVTATARIKKGFPMLSINTDTLIRNVLQEIGETPPDLTECPEHLSSTLSNSTSIIKPFAFAYWGASLINPLPPLGVAPEIRGRILEVPSALDKLKVLEWGLKRSIENLEGTQRL